MSYSKYYLYKKQYSNDSGVTWYDVTPLEQVASGSPIATYDTLQECQGQTIPVTAVTLNTGSISIGTGGIYQLTATVLPTNATNKNVTWSTSNSGVATVNSSGLVTAVSTGNCIITVTTVDGGYTAQCGVVVVDTPPTPTPSSGDYLTFIAEEDSTFRLSGNSVYYSLDSGVTWSTLESNTHSPTVQSGQTIMWKATLTPSTSFPAGIGRFRSSGKFSVQGNIMSLLYGDDFEGQTSLSGKDNAFNVLFYRCSGLTSAGNLALPAITLSVGCYEDMFNGCSGMTTAPALPATNLANECYYGMFRGCTSLTTAPSLPATTLANYCYTAMFGGCTSLTTAPALPATTLTNYCYSGMFNGCTSLTTAPELPATTLAERCYYNMFAGCTSLETAPVLSATTLADVCYCYMFSGCTSLTTAPSLPATTLTSDCYAGMFEGCTSLTTAPQLYARTLAQSCYQGMFSGCISLSSITCLATDISAIGCTINWVNGVASSGTFTKASSMSSWETGINGIPTNWTVQNA